MHEVAESAGGRYLISGIGRSTDPIHHLRVFIPLPRVYETTDERELEAAWLKRFSNSSTWVLQLRKGYDTDEAVPPGSYRPTAPLPWLSQKWLPTSCSACSRVLRDKPIQ